MLEKMRVALEVYQISYSILSLLLYYANIDASSKREKTFNGDSCEAGYYLQTGQVLEIDKCERKNAGNELACVPPNHTKNQDGSHFVHTNNDIFETNCYPTSFFEWYFNIPSFGTPS